MESPFCQRDAEHGSTWRCGSFPYSSAVSIFVLNCGSSSVKYSVVDVDHNQVRNAGVIERVDDFPSAIAHAIERANGHAIEAVGHRVVHGGPHFQAAQRIDAQVLSQIEACIPLAPLHNPHNLAGIVAAQRALPQVPHVAVFDTAFHNRMPRRSRTYALPYALCERLELRRYGFHGPSHLMVARRAATYLKRPLEELRLLTLHLGNGASACAVEFGHSVDTSMGMTPLEGLVMGTRAGDLDPGVALALLRSGLSVDDLERLLHHESGLLGIAGNSGDLRDIEARAAAGDDRARLAISVFAHRVRKYIGAYACAMAGLDAIILTGGIGQHSASMRQRILQRLEFLGLVLDEDRNLSATVDEDAPVAPVHADHARVKALVVCTNEELLIAQETAAILRKSMTSGRAEPIPIAISARHVHLTRETFTQLFGANNELSCYREISQPGQFAANEKVNLIGPRGRIDGVRILGPLRSENQVEVSRTDEFTLGVDAPIRDSGNVKASAPITLEGPAGSVRLSEGLICARRHIHMTPEAAAHHGVRDRDEVEVAITSGPRDLVFGDVLVRVSPSYVVEMHIDTDEANAAELGSGAKGELTYTPVLRASADIQSKRSKVE